MMTFRICVCGAGEDPLSMAPVLLPKMKYRRHQTIFPNHEELLVGSEIHLRPQGGVGSQISVMQRVKSIFVSLLGILRS